MSEELLNKYVDLINKDYCSDCNELNCLGNFPHKKIAKAITNLQEENERLKETLNRNGYFKYNNKVYDGKIILKQREDYKTRIDKAREYIKILGKFDGERCTRNFKMMSADFNHILELLGSDSNE